MLIQCNYTDTRLSHRFVRFEIDLQFIEECLDQIETYMDNLKAEGHILMFKIQMDTDIVMDNQVVSPGISETSGF